MNAEQLLAATKAMVNNNKAIVSWFGNEYDIKTDADSVRAVVLLALMEENGVTLKDVLDKVKSSSLNKIGE